MKRAGSIAAALLLGTVAACASGSPKSSESSDGSTAAAKDTTLTVYAASSLTDTFTELGKRYEESHDGIKVAFNFGASSDLVAQIRQGAPAHVFASADTANMDKVVADHLDESHPLDFASNTLMIAVPPDNPAGVASLKDLTKADAKVVLCAPQVPCGAAAQKVQKAAGITIKPASEEQTVKDVLTKVQSGQADAGLVYVTDVKAAGDTVKGISFRESSLAVNTYQIVRVEERKTADSPVCPATWPAKEFVALVTGAEGHAVLADAGFAKP